MKIATITIIALTLIIIISGLILHGAFGQMTTRLINEDEYTLCNFNNVCIVVSADNVINKANNSKIWNQFNNDIETFSLMDIVEGDSRGLGHD